MKIQSIGNKDQELMTTKKQEKQLSWQPEQEAVLEFNEHKDLVVFASAGSGKTTVMVEKILRYLEGGGEVKKLIVVTFTNNSARDMRDKILDKLKQRVRNASSREVAEHLRKQIVNLPQGDIGTIDSFCNALVQKHYEDIGVNPALGVLSQSETDSLFDEAIEEEINERIKLEDADLKLIVQYFFSGRSMDKIKDIVKEINNKTSAYPHPELEIARMRESCNLEVLENKAIKSYILNIKKQALEYLRQVKVRALGNNLGRYQDLAARLENIGTEYKGVEDFCLKAAGSWFNYPGKLFAADCKNKEERDLYNETRKTVEGLIYSAYSAFGSAEVVKEMEFSSRKIMSLIIDFTESVISRFNDMKAYENKMTFSDVERYAFKILTEEKEGKEVPSKIAVEIAEGKEKIFIDEYQDTNYLQESILRRLSNNNIFMVGDIKQSIYGFRNSEPDIMKEKKERYEKNAQDGKCMGLNDNFRSHPEILDFVNEVFSVIMTEDFGRVDYDKEARMTPFEAFPKNLEEDYPVVTVKFFDDKDDEEESSDEEEDGETLVWPEVYSISQSPKVIIKVDSEAEWVANTILSMVGKQKIFDKKSQNFRSIDFKDIVILQRNRKVTPFAEAFKNKGIPYESVGGDKALLMQDIDTLNSLLRIISNPRQDYPLVFALSSFFGKFSTEDLLSIRKERLDSVSNNPSLSPEEKKTRVSEVKAESFYEAIWHVESEIGKRARDFIEMIDRYREESYLIDVPSLLMKIATETGFDAEMLSSRDMRIASFNTYVEFLRGKDFSTNVETYLKWVDKKLDIDAKLPGSGANCVQINTIHGSKGLEYPVVFLTKCNQGFSSAQISKKDILIEKELGACAKYVDIGVRKLINTPTYLAIAERLAEIEKEEQMRILYVALTRAMNRLIITGKKIPNDFNPDQEVSSIRSLNTLIEYSARRSHVVFSAYNNYDPEIISMADSGKIMPIIKDTLEKISFHEYKYESSTKINNKFSVTQISSGISSVVDENQEYNEILPQMVPFSQEEGTLYHKIMENIDFSRRSGEEVAIQIDSMFKAGLLNTNIDRSVVDDSVIYQALNNPLFKDLEGKKILKEKPFILNLPYRQVVETSMIKDNVIIQGVIDLMAIDGDEVVLIDYKYSRSSPEKLRVRYAEQMRIYALAVEKILKLKVKRKVIYILSQDKVVDFS